MIRRPTRIRDRRTARAVTLALKLISNGRDPEGAARHAASVEQVDPATVYMYVRERLEAQP